MDACRGGGVEIPIFLSFLTLGDMSVTQEVYTENNIRKNKGVWVLPEACLRKGCTVCLRLANPTVKVAIFAENYL